MTEFDSPTYVLDFRDRDVCERIENAIPKKEISVLVRAEHDKGGPSLPARGMLTDEGVFHVTVITDAGEQSHNWTYAFLLDAVRIHGYRERLG